MTTRPLAWARRSLHFPACLACKHDAAYLTHARRNNVIEYWYPPSILCGVSGTARGFPCASRKIIVFIFLFWNCLCYARVFVSNPYGLFQHMPLLHVVRVLPISHKFHPSSPKLLLPFASSHLHPCCFSSYRTAFDSKPKTCDPIIIIIIITRGARASTGLWVEVSSE